MSKYLDSEGLDTLWGIIKSTFAASLSIDGRTISLKNKSEDTLGSTITIPSTATSLATTGTIQIDLASTSSVTYTSGGNITPGVKNALKVANGGTGKNSLDSGKALIGNGTNAVTLRNIYTRTESGNLEWTSGTNEYLLTKGAIAYWNGAYGTTGKSNITTLGTITTGVWNGTAIDVTYGGTGIASNPSMLVNLASTTADTVFEESPRPGVTGTLGIGNGGTGQTSAKNASNAFINALDTETTALQDGDYFIAQTAGGGTTTTTYKRKALSTLATYVENKIGSNYLPLAGGQMTGTLSWKNGTALPAKTSDINYLLTIDSFADGGTTKYATIANVANAIAPTVETAIENDYTFLTQKTAWEIPESADLNTYTTPGIYICRNKTRATTLSNTPCRRGFSLIVLANLLDDDGGISGVIQIVRMFTSHANSLPNQPVYTWQRKLYSNTWSDWVCISGTMAPMSPGMGTDTTVQFTDINFEAAKYGLGSMFHFSSVNGATTVGNPRASANVLQMNYVTATGYDSQLALGSQGKWLALRGQYQGRWSAWNYVQTLNFGVCSTATDVAAKTVTLNSHVSATTGTEVTILFTNGNQATEPKLTINLPEMTDSTGTTYTGGTCGSNVAIYYQGNPVEPGYIKPGDVVRMIYYSSKWYIVGSINASMPSYYATCSTESNVSEKAITIADGHNLSIGSEVTVKFANGNTAVAPTLKINSEASHPILYNGSASGRIIIPEDGVVKLIYDGTNWDIIGAVNQLEAYTHHTRYYIKCNSGNDDNDGLTENTAWKTLDKLLDMLNEGLLDARCYLCEAGDYIISHQFIANAILHIAPTCNGVNLVCDYDDTEAFYLQNCHMKLGRKGYNYPMHVYTKADKTVGYGMTAEGGEISMYYTIIHDKYYAFGGYANFQNSGALWYRFSGTNGALVNTTILNTAPTTTTEESDDGATNNGTRAFYLLRGATISISGTLTLTNLTSAGTKVDNAIFYASTGSNLFLNPDLSGSTETNKYYTGVYASSANVYTYKNRHTQILNHTVSGKSAGNRIANFFINNASPGIYGEDISSVITNL